MKEVDPIYPAIAQSAQLSGPVKLQLQIGADGHVTGSKLLDGFLMLSGSAQEAVKEWVYEPPLKDGIPVATTTTVTIHFNLPAPPNPEDEKIAAKAYPLQEACIKAVSSKADPAQEAQVCQKFAETAELFGPNERFVERREAFVYAATALRRDKQPQKSLDYAEKAVAVVEQGHDDGSGSAAAYGVRAQAEAALGQLPKSLEDLTKAEEHERSAITKMGGPDDPFVKQHYLPTLKGLLTFHAQVLTAMGKPDEAQAKTADAQKL